MEKYIKDVFTDFSEGSNILEAKLLNVNLYKKLDKLQVDIISNKPITIGEIGKFESYLQTRMNVGKALTNIKYEDVEIEQNIEENWSNIISYITSKEPLSRAMLTNSEIERKEQDLSVNLKIKGAEFLCSKKFDKGLEHLLQNVYNCKYNVKIIDCLDDDYYRHVESELQKEEQMALKKANEDAMRRLAENRASQDALIESQISAESGGSVNPSSGQSSASSAPKQSFGYGPKSQNQTFERAPKELPEGVIYASRGVKIKGDPIKIIDITTETENVVVDGEVIRVDSNDMRSKPDTSILIFDLYDGSSTMTCKAFVKKDDLKNIIKKIDGKGIKVDGVARFDNFAKEITIMANIIFESTGLKKVKRVDEAEVKRVELHMHTQMSQMDAVTPCQDLVKRAISWGWNSIAITDHGVVQAFPDAFHLLQKVGMNAIKVIYGVEGYFCPDKDPCVFDSKKQSIDTEYCVLDLETTGISHFTEKITEIGIIKIKDGKEIGTFETFVNPEKPIPEKVQEITHITDDMVKDAPTIEEILPKVIEFIGDSVVVTHNTDFDVTWLKYNYEKYGYKWENTYIDTLRLAKAMFPEYTRYKLGFIADKLGIVVEVAHRALDDVKTLVQVFNQMIEKAKDDKKAKTIDDFDTFETDFKKLPSYHIIILAKNYVGLKNLYKLVSYSHLHYFYKKPRILKSMLTKYREGLIIGSACEAGEVFRAILEDKPEEEIEEIAKFYDYLEIQPIGNNGYLKRMGKKESDNPFYMLKGRVATDEDLMDMNRKILALGDKLGKMTVATCDVHFIDPQDEVYRRILQAGQGYDDADQQAPLYLRTTDEMLKEFSYLGEERAYEVVVTNTNKVAEMCERISPISPEKCPPHIPGCEQQIRDIAYEKAYSLYGNPLPEIVETRLEKELNSIISNGYSVMYIIAQRLVWKSNEDGYIVGSRGSVGSSLAAFMTGITEVNSLPAHYRCPKCKYSDFSDYGFANGFDLPDKDCPKCGAKMDKDGMDIPFETFLGFNGDKEPDIDLNFSGEYQAKAHKYTEVIFGKGTTFKAGTVGTVADKTAFGYVKKYYEEHHKPLSNAEIARQAVGCTGIKRTTGQHPGGIIVVPKGREIFEFTPVQHPADDPNSDIITTHFDYHSIDGNLLKLDILGHDDPTVIRMLQDLSGIKPQDIPLDDKATMSIFSSTEALGVTPEQINSEVGTYGIPEYGTKFARRHAFRYSPNNI